MAGSQIPPVLETWAFGTHMARGHSHYADSPAAAAAFESPAGAAAFSSSAAATAAAIAAPAHNDVDGTAADADSAASALASSHSLSPP